MSYLYRGVRACLLFIEPLGNVYPGRGVKSSFFSSVNWGEKCVVGEILYEPRLFLK